MRRLTLSAVAFLLIAAALAGCGTVADQSIRTTIDRTHEHFSPVADIVAHRFVDPFELDGGGLLVLPPPAGYRPLRAVRAVEEEAWATAQLSGTAAPLALGVVTITRERRGIPVVRHLIAWVALARQSGFYSCGAYVPVQRHAPSLPSPSWSAVVIGDAAGSPALYYQSAEAPCGSVVPTSVQRALEVLSVPWILSDGDVRALAPVCSTLYMSSFGSTPTSSTYEYVVQLREGNSTTLGAIASPPGCAARRWIDLRGDPDADGAGPSTIHGRVGLLPQVDGTLPGGRFSTSPSVVSHPRPVRGH